MSVQGKVEKYAAAWQKAFQDNPARQRMELLFDKDTFVEMDGFAEASGVICGYGAVMGSPVCAFAQDGSGVGAAHSKKVQKLYDLALKTGVPVVGIYDSHGARVDEGIGALDAYGEMLLRINNLSGVVPQISLVLGICAGTSAVLACSADYVVMSEKAEFFLSSPAAGDDAEGAGSAANAAKAGVAHVVCADDAASCNAVRKLISMLPLNNLSSPPCAEYSEVQNSAQVLEGLELSCETVKGSEIAAAVCDLESALELLAEFGQGAYTAMATMGGLPCGVVATNGEKLDADSCVKIAKMVTVCDAFQIPVLTFVNTPGIKPSAKAELCGSVRELAKLAHVYAEATTAKISVVTGKAYGAAYVALAGRAAGTDYTVAWPGATISALEPKTAVAFLYSDRITDETPREQVENEYCENEASPVVAARGGYIDDVIPANLTRPAILAAMDLLSAKRVSKNPKKHGNLPM